MGNGGKRHEWAPIGTNASVMDVWNHEMHEKHERAYTDGMGLGVVFSRTRMGKNIGCISFL